MHVRVAPFVVSADVDGDLVVMNEQLEFYRLDAMGREIWGLIERGLDTPAIASDLASRYPVDEPTILEHVSVFIRQLVADGLVVSAPEAAQG